MKAAHHFICPLCEVHELEPHGRDSAFCPQCGRLSRVFLKTLREISALPDAIGYTPASAGTRTCDASRMACTGARPAPWRSYLSRHHGPAQAGKLSRWFEQSVRVCGDGYSV
jgi:hypothetical protein